MAVGPSPRVRGSRADAAPDRNIHRSIPACAGKPITFVRLQPACRVHPRVCGEALDRRAVRGPDAGPSPRVRGSPVRPRPAAPTAGSIPACAGKPATRSISIVRSRVHPRVCGEADVQTRGGKTVEGPSPRVRGSPRSRPRRRGNLGSIPACAGKPGRRGHRARHPPVHPRVCGEAARCRRRRLAGWGPSPRVRGSPLGGAVKGRGVGSIPACAGKPAVRQPAGRGDTVHPRVCGEAHRSTADLRHSAGPSPRVRGSLLCHRSPTQCRGSIPACAGKPHGPAAPARTPAVHPRVCGEAP